VPGAAAAVVAERRGPAAVLTFNRPGKLNAISSAMLGELADRLGQAESDAEVRAVVLTGAGDRAFVAGADIGEYAGGTEQEFRAYQRRSREVFSRLATFGKPVIAAVNGYALGGGFEIALCCDVVIASARARFGLPEGLLGLCPGGGGTQRLTWAAGPYAAARVLLFAEQLTADEALRLGLVAAVVEPDALMDAALEAAGRAARVAPLAAREMKRLVAAAREVPLAAGLDREHEALFGLYQTRDAREGIAAFTGKRQARFEGR
jgi:enoyl-CoA hydratase/carnithine racemase